MTDLSPQDFRLSHSDEPQPVLLDADPVTTAWPMPAGGKWEPIPPQSLWARWVALCVSWWEAVRV